MVVIHPAERLLRSSEAAALAHVHATTLRRWARIGLLPAAATLPSGHRRFRASDVRAVVETASAEV